MTHVAHTVARAGPADPVKGRAPCGPLREDAACGLEVESGLPAQRVDLSGAPRRTVNEALAQPRLCFMTAWTRLVLSAGFAIRPAVLGFTFGVRLRPALSPRWRRGL